MKLLITIFHYFRNKVWDGRSYWNLHSLVNISKGLLCMRSHWGIAIEHEIGHFPIECVLIFINTHKCSKITCCCAVEKKSHCVLLISNVSRMKWFQRQQWGKKWKCALLSWPAIQHSRFGLSQLDMKIRIIFKKHSKLIQLSMKFLWRRCLKSYLGQDV